MTERKEKNNIINIERGKEFFQIAVIRRTRHSARRPRPPQGGRGDSGQVSAYPEGCGGFCGTPATDAAGVPIWGILWRLWDWERKPHGISGRRASGLWPGVGRLWAENVTATERGTKYRPGEGAITNGAVGRITHDLL